MRHKLKVLTSLASTDEHRLGDILGPMEGLLLFGVEGCPHQLPVVNAITPPGSVSEPMTL